MRLINIKTLELEEFFGDRIPRYAILSHTWEDQEISFQEYNWILEHQRNLQDGIIDELAPRQRLRVQTKFNDLEGRTGYSKIHDFLSIARGFQNGCVDVESSLGRILKYQMALIDYVWIDTCCINKESSAELSEAINSMYEWYRNAVFCITYLGDVSCQTAHEITGPSDLRKSRWFTRGWTLQELLVPRHVSFYNRHWQYITSRNEICELLEEITGISRDFLTGPSRKPQCSVATKMSWAARRKTTRVEDEAYCLLGLFGVNMPLLYGEGARAFQRLQNEIMRTSDDQSMFLWGYDQPIETTASTSFAPSPKAFGRSADLIPSSWALVSFTKKPFFLTNIGLHISLNLLRTPTGIFAVLPFTDARGWLLGIPLDGLDHITNLKDVDDGTAIARKIYQQPLALFTANSRNIGGLVLKTLTMVDRDVLTTFETVRSSPSEKRLVRSSPSEKRLGPSQEFRLKFSYDDHIDIIEHYCPELRASRHRFEDGRMTLAFDGSLRQNSLRTKKRSGTWAAIYFRARARKQNGIGQPSQDFVVKLALDDTTGKLLAAHTTNWEKFCFPSEAPSMAALFLVGGVEAGQMGTPVNGMLLSVRQKEEVADFTFRGRVVGLHVTLSASVSEI